MSQIKFTTEGKTYVTIYGCPKCREYMRGMNFINYDLLTSIPDLLAEFEEVNGKLTSYPWIEVADNMIPYSSDAIYGTFTDQYNNVTELTEHSISYRGKVIYQEDIRKRKLSKI